MNRKVVRPLALSIAAASVYAAPAGALEFSFGEQSVKLENLITVGGMLRMQDRDPTLIGKPNVTPGLCLTRLRGGTPEGGPSTDLDENDYGRGQIGAVCATNNPVALAQFNAAPGAYTPNGDNGNLNFDKGDLVHATAKITSDLTLDLFDFNIFARGVYFYDAIYSGLDDYHPDRTLAPRETEFKGSDAIGNGFEMLDYFVSRTFEVGEHNIAFKLGNQVLNWGESAFLIPNSLNSISPPNQALLRIPGFDIKELFQPVGMAYVSTDLFAGMGVEAFYQYDWKPVVADPPGSFFSQSDTLGPGGSLAMLSFARAAEDYGFPVDDPRYPAGRRGFYRAIDTCQPENVAPPDQPHPCVDAAGLIGSTSSRSIFRDLGEEERRMPKDGGQYGVALKYFADWLNGGTDFGLYYANYHSRFPVVSAMAALDTCIPSPTANPAQNAANLAASCQITPNPNGTGVIAANEPVPVDTVRLIVEYPENIEMYGFSFNTTVGDYALAGEYTYRPELPMQVHTTDLVYAALQPAFPTQDYSIGATSIPGRRSAVPDFLMTNYRNQTVTAGQYIRGYELMAQGQADVTLLKTFGGDNLLRASQIVALLEMGHTYVFDFPEIDELQFNGAGADTHISSGADGSIGTNPRDVRTVESDAGTNRSANGSRQNPTTHTDYAGFGTEQSWGYRLVGLTRYDDAFFGANLEFLTAFFHDVRGTGPGIGQNFVQGRRSILGGIRFDYLSRYTGEIRYTWFTGGNKRDQLRDRDNLLFWVGYQF